MKASKMGEEEASGLSHKSISFKNFFKLSYQKSSFSVSKCSTNNVAKNPQLLDQIGSSNVSIKQFRWNQNNRFTNIEEMKFCPGKNAFFIMDNNNNNLEQLIFKINLFR